MQSALSAMPAPSTTTAGARILNAASELFYLRGINRTGVDLIADHAEVTKRTLYQRFGSKDQLIAAYLQRRANLWQTGLLDVLLDAADAQEQLTALYGFAEQWIAANSRGCAFVNAWVEVSEESHPAIAVIRAEKAWMRTLLHNIAQDSGTAEVLYLLYEGAQVSASLEQSVSPLRAAREASIRVVVLSAA